MSVLLCLAKHSGETLSKEQLFQALWPNIHGGASPGSEEVTGTAHSPLILIWTASVIALAVAAMFFRTLMNAVGLTA